VAGATCVWLLVFWSVVSAAAGGVRVRAVPALSSAPSITSQAHEGQPRPPECVCAMFVVECGDWCAWRRVHGGARPVGSGTSSPASVQRIHRTSLRRCARGQQPPPLHPHTSKPSNKVRHTQPHTARRPAHTPYHRAAGVQRGVAPWPHRATAASASSASPPAPGPCPLTAQTHTMTAHVPVSSARCPLRCAGRWGVGRKGLNAQSDGRSGGTNNGSR
jgi:hypothetical protein